MKTKTVIAVTLCAPLLFWAGRSHAMNAKTHKGPAVAGLKSSLSMVFRGHNNQFLWEAFQDGVHWQSLGQVHDAAETSWAFSNHTPALQYMTLPARGGLDPRTEKNWLYLFYTGHQDDELWYSRRPVDRVGNDVNLHSWQGMRKITSLPVMGSPGAAAHVWDNNNHDPTPVVAFPSYGHCGNGNLAPEGSLVVMTGNSLESPSRWDFVDRVEGIGRITGPAVVSHQGALTIFVTDKVDNRVRMLRSRSNDPLNPDWAITTVPSARSVAAPAAVVMNGYIYLAFRGHNNNYIWLRRYDGAAWRNIGYVEDLLTGQRPALAVVGNYYKKLSLAYRPSHDVEICVGEIDLDNPLPAGDVSAHDWRSTRFDGVDCVPAPSATSCVQEAICGGRASGGCWCDDACVRYGDCCDDAPQCQPSVPCHCSLPQNWFTDPLLDRSHGDPVASEVGGIAEDLMCYLDTSMISQYPGPAYGNFVIYSNPANQKRTTCADGLNERIHADDVERIGHILECTHALYHEPDMSAPDLVFHNPLDGNHTCHQQDPADPFDDQIPVWINSCGGGNGANSAPRIYLDALGGSIPPEVDANAIHEYGHSLFKSYNWYFNGGLLQFINEGFPVLATIPASANFSAADPKIMPWRTPHCDLDGFLNLSVTPLHEHAYCEAAVFWYGVFSKYTDLAIEPYAAHELPPACEIYRDSLDPAMPAMYKMVGRDVLLKLQEKFATCHPGGMPVGSCGGSTPYCTEDGGFFERCSTGGGDLGCVSRSGSFDPGSTDAERANDLDGRGDLLMPLALQLLDETLAEDFDMAGDGLDYFAYRDWLKDNYLHSSGTPPMGRTDGDGFYLRSFAANYHEVDVSSGAKSVWMFRTGDLSKWAFTVFYRNSLGQAVEIRPWSNVSAAFFTIPTSSQYSTAVVVVTALDGIIEKGTHSQASDAVGHYQLHTW